MNKGKYIVLEGLDGSGKTTQHEKLLNLFGPKAIGVREPGGTPMAEQIRNLVKDKSLERSPNTNAFLFSAARADLVDTIIRPNIAHGLTVIADRNWLSTIAYQSAEGFDTVEIEKLSQIATQEFFKPDLIIFIDTNVKICQERLAGRGGTEADFFDEKGSDYFTKVRAAYLEHIKKFKNFAIIDGNKIPDEVAGQIEKSLNNFDLT